MKLNGFRMILLMSIFVVTLSLTAQEPTNVLYPAMKADLVLSIPTGENNPRNSEGDFIRLDNGDILYVYTHYYGKSADDHASAYLASRRSSDDGRTWTAEDKIELENEGQLNIMSVSCRRTFDGKVALFYLVKEAVNDCRPYMRVLNADGSWGERSCCIPDVSYNVLNNDRVAILSSGRILLPIGRHAFKGGDQYNYEWNAEIFCMYSDDNGQTWVKGNSVEKTEGIVYQEPGVCELEDGRILINIRTDGKCQYFAYSADGGVTFDKPFASCIDSPLSPTLIKRIPNRDELLAVGNPLLNGLAAGGGSRNAMTIERLSADGDKILARKALEFPENSPGWQYPSILFLDDGNLLVAYFSWPTGVRVYRMNLAEL